MMTGDSIDWFDALWVVLFAIGTGVIIGVQLHRREWIKACRAKKLIRFDSATGDLIWVDDKTEVP